MNVVKTYKYTDESGGLLYEVCRLDPKDFRQRRPDGHAGWLWNLQGIARVLYRLPEVIRDVERGLPVIVAENEKDCDALTGLGLCATCGTGGAGKWLDSYSDALTGAAVYILPYKDEPGRRHAEQVAASLQNKTASVSVLELPDRNGAQVKDAADFIQAGGTLPQLQTLLDGAPQWTPKLLTRKATDARAALLPSEPDRATECNDNTGGLKVLPQILDAMDFMATPQPPPPELVAGLLHQGSKRVLGGGSKSVKTWTLLDLALSVAHGQPWLGFDTERGQVLYLNFEIQAYAWQRRIEHVADAKGITLDRGAPQLWNLRGHAADFSTLLPAVAHRIKSKGFSLIVLDPIYKLYGRTDENKASDVAALLNGLEALTVETRAAVAFGAHFSKGNQAAKEAMDRISGSGVFARDPDSLLMFTRHEQQDAFTVDSMLRNFKPCEQFAVRWQFPLMHRDGTLDPARLKQPGGRKPEHTPEDLLKVLPPSGLSNVQWLDAAEAEGMSKRTFYRLRKVSERAGKVLHSKVSDKWQPIKPKTKASVP